MTTDGPSQAPDTPDPVAGTVDAKPRAVTTRLYERVRSVYMFLVSTLSLIVHFGLSLLNRKLHQAHLGE